MQPTYPTAAPADLHGREPGATAGRARRERPGGRRGSSVVDSWVGGRDIYGFDAWNAALVGQLTGDPKYCTAAVAAIDSAGRRSEPRSPAAATRSSRTTATRGRRRRSATSRWSTTGATAAIGGPPRRVARLRAPGRVERVEPDEATWGGTACAVERLGDRQPVEQLLLLVPAGDDAARPRRPRRVPGGERVARRVPRHARSSASSSRRSTPISSAAARARAPATASSMRRLFELYDIWQASTGENLANKTRAHARVDAGLHAPDRADARSRRADRRPVARLGGGVLRLSPRRTCWS